MAGGGNIVVLGANNKKETQGAYVTDHALHVNIVAGGGGGGLTEPVEVEQSVHDNLNANVTVQVGDVDVSNANPVPVSDAGGSLTVDGTVAATQSGAWNVTVQEPLSVDDNGGSLTVDQPTRTLLLTNSSVQLQGVDVVAGGGAGVARAQRIPVSEYGAAGLPNFYANVAGVYELPSTIIADPVTAGTCGVNVTTRALLTGPSRITAIQSLFAAQVFNNVTTAANSGSINTTNYRWAVVYINLTRANTPTDIRLIAQFSDDAGTTWFDYSVDQWVDLRYVPAQMPLTECIPLNYVVGRLFRLRAVATGTTAANTFTLTATMEMLT